MPVRSVYRAIVAACVVRFACVVQCALQGYVEYNTTHSVSFTAYPRHALCFVMWWTWMYGLCLLCHSNTCKHFCKCKCVYISCVGRSCLVIDSVMLQSIVNLCVCGALECMLSLGVDKHFVCFLCFVSRELWAKPWTLTL